MLCKYVHERSRNSDISGLQCGVRHNDGSTRADDDDGSTHSDADANDTGATDAGANHASATHAGWRVPVHNLHTRGLLQHSCKPVLPSCDRPQSVQTRLHVVLETGSDTASDPGASDAGDNRWAALPTDLSPEAPNAAGADSWQDADAYTAVFHVAAIHQAAPQRLGPHRGRRRRGRGSGRPRLLP